MLREGDLNIMTTATTKRSKEVEQCIEILSDIFGSKEEVLITLLEILESDGDFTHKQEKRFSGRLKSYMNVWDRAEEL